METFPINILTLIFMRSPRGVISWFSPNDHKHDEFISCLYEFEMSNWLNASLGYELSHNTIVSIFGFTMMRSVLHWACLSYIYVICCQHVIECTSLSCYQIESYESLASASVLWNQSSEPCLHHQNLEPKFYNNSLLFQID